MKKILLVALMVSAAIYGCDESEVEEIQNVVDANITEARVDEFGIQVDEAGIKDVSETNVMSDKYGPASSVKAVNNGQDLSWQSNAPSGISNSGRNLHGANDNGTQPLAYFTNDEVDDGPNGETISMTFDYDLTQNVTHNGFGTNNIAGLNFHLQGSGGGYGSGVPPISLTLTRSYLASSVTLTGLVVSASNYNTSVSINTTIPLQGTIEVTSSDIRVNGTSLFTQAVHVPFTYLKVTLSEDVSVSDIDLTGFGEGFSCDGTNSVCAVYLYDPNNSFSGFYENFSVNVAYDQLAISSSTVAVYLKRQGLPFIFDGYVLNEPNDGLVESFRLPGTGNTYHDYYIEVVGGGVTLTSPYFTIQNHTLPGGGEEI